MNKYVICGNFIGREKMVRSLIENGADINALNNNKNSALMLALDKGM